MLYSLICSKHFSGTHIVCQTQPNDIINHIGLVQMEFDNAQITFTEGYYHYVEDPTIVDVYRHKSIISGGMLVNVLGTNLDSVQYPKMYVNHRGMEFFGVSRHSCWNLLYCQYTEASSHISSIQNNIYRPAPGIISLVENRLFTESTHCCDYCVSPFSWCQYLFEGWVMAE